MMLPGWNCVSCLVFNGEEKEPRDTCRSCGSARKTFGLPLESVMQYIRLIETNLANAQECGTRFHNRIVDLTAKLARFRVTLTTISTYEDGYLISASDKMRELAAKALADSPDTGSDKTELEILKNGLARFRYSYPVGDETLSRLRQCLEAARASFDTDTQD